MARFKVKLTRNLRRSLMRGHPWVYKDAVSSATTTDRALLAQVFDAKGELGWAIYDPHSPLALRLLCTTSAPPSAAFFEKRFARALQLRAGVRSPSTTAFRLFNGEGDLLPGLVCDVYGSVAVLQFDGQGPGEFWDKAMIAGWLLKAAGVSSVVEKTRRSRERTMEHLAGEPAATEVSVVENSAQFRVNLEKGQKTGFFLDQRENRNYLRSISAGKSVLNLFSYTGGFSINAGLGGARRVASLDIAACAIQMASENWALNGLPPERHVGLCEDVFKYLGQSGGDLWDHILVDPPSMSHSEDQKPTAMAKYIEIFSAAAKRVAPDGHLSLSSCSSHISFDDFFEIISEAWSAARRRGVILRVSGQGPDHPFPHACPELRYLKFVHLAL